MYIHQQNQFIYYNNTNTYEQYQEYAHEQNELQINNSNYSSNFNQQKRKLDSILECDEEQEIKSEKRRFIETYDDSQSSQSNTSTTYTTLTNASTNNTNSQITTNNNQFDFISYCIDSYNGLQPATEFDNFYYPSETLFFD